MSDVTTTTEPRHRKKMNRLTDTNSDYKCLSDNANVFQRFLYKVSLHTGGYMLNAYERFALNLVVWTCLGFMGMYCYAFVSGFVDGLREATTTSVSVNNALDPEVIDAGSYSDSLGGSGVEQCASAAGSTS